MTNMAEDEFSATGFLDKLEAKNLVIREIVGIHADVTILKDGKIDLDKLEPLILGQITLEYRSLGQKIGQAWKIGKE